MVIAVTYPEVSDCQALANGFRSFLDRLGISRAVFSGSSFGALWLQCFAARFPAYVAAALLANAFLNSPSTQALFDHLLSIRCPAVVAAVNRTSSAAAGQTSDKAHMARKLSGL